MPTNTLRELRQQSNTHADTELNAASNHAFLKVLSDHRAFQLQVHVCTKR